MEFEHYQRGGGTAKVIIIGVVVLLLLIYVGGAVFFRNHYVPGTKINGVVCSMKNEEQAKEAIREEVRNYEIKIIEREDREDSIIGKDVGIDVDFDSTMDTLYDLQSPLKWPIGHFKPVDRNVGVTVSLDSKMFDDAVDNLSAFDEDVLREPVDATVTYSSADATYVINPEDMGTKIDKDALKARLNDAILALDDKLVLEDEDIYINPKHLADDEDVKKALSKASKYVTATGGFKFDTEIYPLDADTISSFINIDQDTFKVTFVRDSMVAYVTGMSKKYNTIFETRKFKTSYGYDVTVKGGDYGWWIDEGATIDEMKEFIKAGDSKVKEPVYLQKAMAYGEDDIGGTYVEVNLSMQHVLLYKDGKLVDESDCVTGKDNSYTPPGVYSITYKDHTYKNHKVALVGENYSSDVMYFIPFFGNIGLHDASWRSQFGGDIYKKNGSHGCVNLPLSMAESIFNTVDKDMPVVVYQDPNNPAYTKKAKMSKIYSGE